MSRRLPPLPALQAFEAAARHENFAAAAKELNLSQSAVSHRVRSLEQHLGAPLFERLPRGLRPTEAAKAYLPSVRQAFEDILGATSGVFGQRTPVVLTVRAPVSYTSIWLAKIIDRFQAEYPHVAVQLTSSIWAERTAAGETDVELRIGRGNWSGYTAELLFRDPLVAVCAPDLAVSLGAPADPSSILEQALIHVMGTEDYWAEYFAKASLSRTQNARDIRVDSSMTAAELAASGNRIALIHERFARHYLDLGRIAIACPESITPREGIYLLHPESTEHRKPEALLFERWIKTVVGEM